MLKRLINHIGKNSLHEVLIVDDGSDWVNNRPGVFKSINDLGLLRGTDFQVLLTAHSGKRGFWKKWVIAREIALGSNHDYFLFLPDDITDLNLNTIEALTKQGWEDHLFAVNVINCDRTECWGKFSTGQESFKVNDTELKEVGFVDCGFLTNRLTLGHTEVHEVTSDWFTRENISSGVGAQMTNTMRALKAVMMMPTPGLCKHSRKHASVMHPEPVKHKSNYLMTIHCINLNERPEKWQAAQSELKKLKGVALRWEGVKKSPGWEGCRLSHLALLQHLRFDYPGELYGVFEDDVIFTHQFPLHRLEEIMVDLPNDWDILYLGATINEKPEFVTNNLYRIKNAWTTHAMIFNNQNGVVDYILENNGGGGKIDVFYAHDVQHKFKCYLANPMLATQRNGHSDIMNKYVPTGDIIQQYFNKHTK